MSYDEKYKNYRRRTLEYREKGQILKNYEPTLRRILTLIRIIYVDETGIDKIFSRKYARTSKGKKIYEKVRGNKSVL